MLNSVDYEKCFIRYFNFINRSSFEPLSFLLATIGLAKYQVTYLTAKGVTEKCNHKYHMKVNLTIFQKKSKASSANFKVPVPVLMYQMLCTMTEPLCSFLKKMSLEKVFIKDGHGSYLKIYDSDYSNRNLFQYPGICIHWPTDFKGHGWNCWLHKDKGQKCPGLNHISHRAFSSADNQRLRRTAMLIVIRINTQLLTKTNGWQEQKKYVSTKP